MILRQSFRSSCLVLAFSLLLGGCGPQRSLIPPGEIPQQSSVSAEDEQFGQEVLGELSDQFKLSTNDSDINRVRDIANRITSTTTAGGHPWNIYVFNDDSFPNAAATRGNYIFVWSGIIRKTQNDAELATVIAHEVAHVLAGHVLPTPAEEVNEMLSGLAGEVVSQVVAQGSYGAAAGLAGALVQTAIQAAIVNPQQQQKELEADQIGIFLMADAGYDPAQAVEFWRRVQNDKDIGGQGLGLAVLSSHPPSLERLRRIEALLPQAQARYRSPRGTPLPAGDSFAMEPAPRRTSRAPRRPDTFAQTSPSSRPVPAGFPSRWVVIEFSTEVHQNPDPASRVVAELPQGASITAIARHRGWLQISSPERGFVRGVDLTPGR